MRIRYVELTLPNEISSANAVTNMIRWLHADAFVIEAAPAARPVSNSLTVDAA
ncbi:MAG: hypothetical protein ACJ796_15075 [Gemmatimonadaceae bacterium]